MSDKPTFFELAERLDILIPLQPPTPEQVEEATKLIEDGALERYFFKHLAASENPGWFEPLKQRGFFDTPPEPIEREGTISYPRWPALWYLVAIAPKCPDRVIEVAEKTHTQDPFLMLDLVRATRSMSPVYAAQMVPLVVRWADEGMKVEENVVYLATYLAQKDQWAAALTLVELILSPQEQQLPQKANSKADRYLLQAFVERGLAFFLEHHPLKVLHIVQKNLERAIDIEEREGHDSSWIWRSAIEPHEQNLEFGEIKDLLVDAAVQALGSVVKTTPDQGRTILEAYLGHRYSIFRRLAIHTIRLNVGLWLDLEKRLFTEQQYLEDTEIYHEYWMLMHDVYDSLPASVQDSFVECLLNKLPQEREDDRQYHRQRYWVLRRLWAIKDFLSSDEHRKVLAELVDEYVEPDYPSFLSYSSTLVGSVSPKTSEELSKSSPEDILAELKKKLPFDFVDGPTQEGLADVLKAAIVSNPQHFASIAPKLIGADIAPIYTYHALWGFRDAWKEGRTFDWEPVLELCDEVSQTSEEATESGEPPDMRPGYWMITYASARGAVADLLEAGVVRDDNAISHRFLDRVRDILLVFLAYDANPSPEYERKWGIERPFGMLDLALNVTRGKAVEALLQYALHVARISAQEQEAGERPLPPGSRMEEVVKDKLTEKLDKQADPSLAVHSLFGKYLPNLHYLDEEWVVAHLEDIFPRQPEMSDYWEAAWDGYLFGSRFYGYLYEILRPYYRYAIEQMALGTQGKAGSELSRGRLARHLAALYWRGIETLEGDDSLIPLFFDSAPDEIRTGFVIGLRAALRGGKPSADSEEWLRVKALWEARDRAIGEIAEREGQLTDFIKELGAFTGWVPLIPEDLGNFYPMIEVSGLVSENPDAIRLLEFLASVAGDHAPFVVSFLEKLLQQDRGPWFLATEYDTIRTILEAAMSSGDEQVRSCAVRVINLFGERGDERYRDLLRR